VSRQFSSERLDALREARGITWYRLGVDAGMSPTNATAHYLMQHEPKANRLAALADALGCSMDDLFEDDEAQPDLRPGRSDGETSAEPRRRFSWETTRGASAARVDAA
jgi:transcriptional regulator with XRE-family HTH domain